MQLLFLIVSSLSSVSLTRAMGHSVHLYVEGSALCVMESTSFSA